MADNKTPTPGQTTPQGQQLSTQITQANQIPTNQLVQVMPPQHTLTTSMGFIAMQDPNIVAVQVLQSRIQQLEMEKKQIHDKYTALLEQQTNYDEEFNLLQQQIDSFQALLVEKDEQIKQLQDQLQIKDKEIKEIKEDLNQVKKDMAQYKRDQEKKHECLILGELARQTEKAICRNVLGANTRIYSLTVMFKALKDDTDAKQRWQKLKNEIKWTNELLQVCENLKAYRLPHSHPQNTPQNESISAEYLRKLIPKHNDNKDDQKDAEKLVDILSQLNNGPLFVVDE